MVTVAHSLSFPGLDIIQRPELTQTSLTAAELIQSMAGKVPLTKGRPEDRESRADILSLRHLVDSFRRIHPDYSLLAEGLKEHGPKWEMYPDGNGIIPGASNYCAVIDPICGSTAFAAGVPSWIISVGIVEIGIDNIQFSAGYVYDPNVQEFFIAENGKAWLFRPDCDHQPINVRQFSEVGNGAPIEIEQSMLRGKQAKTTQERDWWRNVNYASSELAFEFGMLDCVASCGLPICWVAAGRYAAMVKAHQPIYDYAAGAAILLAAGGRFTDWSGRNLIIPHLRSDLRINFAATNGQPEVLELIQKHLGPLDW
jgi:myo-inositol-1(or 4)-monophosphatase